MGKKLAMNPYLPLWEHVPDGEPHVFGDRLYIYGSHDRSHGTTFCMEDYVCWSAPVNDLGDWRREGVIWRKTDDPDNRDPVGYLYAPDVARGPDGRYYLYYFYSAGNNRAVSIRAAVCDTPAGKYQFYGEVSIPGREPFLCFDPAVFVDDDGRIWLYYGSAFQNPSDALKVQGGAVVELAADMKTVISKPKLTVPNITHQKGLGMHAFFEASSMRKINGKYYFIYSSMLSHELCYAVSDRPDGPFTFGGTIISNGDIGLNGNKKAVAPTGNNHGSLVEINSSWYIFYHRHTQGTGFSRQGCAEPVTILPDGKILQGEVTSCGLNGTPLPAEGIYSAAYCCSLTGSGSVKPCIQEEETDGEKVFFVQGIQNGCTMGFKYFDFSGPVGLRVSWRASLQGQKSLKAMSPAQIQVNGKLELRTAPDDEAIGEIPISGSAGDWESAEVKLSLRGKHALYLAWYGKGALDIQNIEFIQDIKSIKQNTK